jgi:hypothetical protein
MPTFTINGPSVTAGQTPWNRAHDEVFRCTAGFDSQNRMTLVFSVDRNIVDWHRFYVRDASNARVWEGSVGHGSCANIESLWGQKAAPPDFGQLITAPAPFTSQGPFTIHLGQQCYKTGSGVGMRGGIGSVAFGSVHGPSPPPQPAPPPLPGPAPQPAPVPPSSETGSGGEADPTWIFESLKNPFSPATPVMTTGQEVTQGSSGSVLDKKMIIVLVICLVVVMGGSSMVALLMMR